MTLKRVVFGIMLTILLGSFFTFIHFIPVAKSSSQTIFSDDFSADSGMWEYLGTAYRDPTSHYLVLTEPFGMQAGAVFLNTSFRTFFTANFSYEVGGGSGADGFAMFFYKKNYTDLGEGGGLGFVGHAPNINTSGYGVEFDSWKNGANPDTGEPEDPSASHIALIKDLALNHLAYVNDLRTEDFIWHNVSVVVRFSSVDILVDGSSVLSWNGTIDRTFNCFGFCGATGGGTNWHIIDDFSIQIDSVLIVPDDYPTIQEAINAASDGDSVYVRNGEYFEDIIVNKSLNLIGESRADTIIDRATYQTTNPVFINASNVIFANFTVDYGVLLSECHDNLIVNNSIYELTLMYSNHNTISNNTSLYFGLSYNCTSNEVSDNVFGRIGFGQSCGNNLFRRNTMETLQFELGDISDLMEDIDVSNMINGKPIYYLVNQSFVSVPYDAGFVGLINCSDIQVSNASLSNFNGYGLFAVCLRDSTISDSLFTNCSFGLFMERSTDNRILRNHIYNNMWGIVLIESNDNVLFHNEFGNVLGQQVSSFQSQNAWDNGYPCGGNYWSSEYSGTDMNHDSIGDSVFVLDSNNTDNFPLMNPWSPPDFGVRNLTTSKTIIGAGYTVNINSSIDNLGNKVDEFTLDTWLNGSLFSSENYTLASGNLNLTRVWNTTGFAKGNYSLTISVEPLQDEVNVTNNNVTAHVFITIPGDLNGDKTVNILDAIILSNHFGFNRYHPLWDASVDLKENGIIDILDAIILAANYGKSWT